MINLTLPQEHVKLLTAATPGFLAATAMTLATIYAIITAAALIALIQYIPQPLETLYKVANPMVRAIQLIQFALKPWISILVYAMLLLRPQPMRLATLFHTVSIMVLTHVPICALMSIASVVTVTARSMAPAWKDTVALLMINQTLPPENVKITAAAIPLLMVVTIKILAPTCAQAHAVDQAVTGTHIAQIGRASL